MAVLSVGILFLALSAAEGQTPEHIQAEVPIIVLMPIETFVHEVHGELSDDFLGAETAKESESSQQVKTDIETQDRFDSSASNFEETLTLPEHTPEIIINTVLDESYEIEDDDESELPLDIHENASAIAESGSEEIGIEAQESDAGFGSNSDHKAMELKQITEEEILTSCLPQEAEPFQIPHRIISSDDFTSSINISQLVLEKTSNGYKAVKDMALVLAISNCSDKAIRVRAAVRFEAGAVQLYEALGFTVPKESKDIILGAGEEQSMTWPFYCGQDLSSGTVSAIPSETDLTFRLDFTCEWEDVI